MSVPIQTGCHLAFPSRLDGFFPGLEPGLESGPRPFPLQRPKRSAPDAFEETWTMYMLRCPGCGHWQEQREHGCDALAWELLRLFRTVVQILLCQGEQHLELGWHCFAYYSLPEQYVKESRGWKENLRSIEDLDPYENGDGLQYMKYSYVAALREFYEQFQDLWTRMRTRPESPEEDILKNVEFSNWINCYHESEANWFWLKEVGREIERNLEILVAWALGRDGAALK
ncbi:unnamed protein product [Clonostachys rosea]|uniref:Uncharacterized protein n=1 Tax=Bionectria ochroleuca TaxID=29856 RepID=A0ABY6UJ37_BIOOC|nr:unnamed protein product [Clonostachys rosea]